MTTLSILRRIMLGIDREDCLTQRRSIGLPNLATSILAAEMGYGCVFVMCAFASLTAFGIYLVMYLRLKKIIPALADAS